MMSSDQFDTYFTKAQQLSIRAKKDSQSLNDLLQNIEHERDAIHENSPYKEFLNGEHDFYSCNYKNALQSYLKAKSIPYFKLFCYRASAYAAKEAGDSDRAMSFARRALLIYPDDYTSLILLEQLLMQDSHMEEALQFRDRIQALEFEHQEQKQNHTPFEKFQSNVAFSIPKELHATALKNPRQVTSTAVLEEKLEPNLDQFQSLIGVSQCNPPISSQSICFTSSHSKESDSTPILTQKLYSSLCPDKSPFNSLTSAPKAAFMTPIEELKNLANVFVGRTPLASHPVPFLSQEAPPEEILEHTIRNFQHHQKEQISHYLDLFKTRPVLKEHCLYLLHGYNSQNKNEPLLTGQSRKTSGGYYLRWNNKGIVINPGLHFLDHFHQQGLHIKDIDYVIVTGDSPSSYADIHEIYELNYQLNKINSELQIIHYYLNPKAYQTLSPMLKPNYKQERNTVHCLEFFLDSPDIEKVELEEGINFYFFPLSSISLGLRFDLSSATIPDLRLGYLSGTPWSSSLAAHLGPCDLLIAGFGTTSSSDYGRLKYNEESLGYYGTYTLLEEIQPKLLLCSEFDGEEGDVRLEVVKMMRQHSSSTILPVDIQLFLDLATLQIQCSVTKTLVDPRDVRIVKLCDRYGNLHYLSSRCSL